MTTLKQDTHAGKGVKRLVVNSLVHSSNSIVFTNRMLALLIPLTGVPICIKTKALFDLKDGAEYWTRTNDPLLVRQMR